MKLPLDVESLMAKVPAKLTATARPNLMTRREYRLESLYLNFTIGTKALQEELAQDLRLDLALCYDVIEYTGLIRPIYNAWPWLRAGHSAR
jgi:hypothetical protein